MILPHILLLVALWQRDFNIVQKDFFTNIAMATAIVTSLLRNDKKAGSRDVNGVPLTVPEEARWLIEALQQNEISEEDLIRVANQKNEEYSADNPEKFARQVRTKKLFKYLDLNRDGVISHEEVLDVKGRLYRRLRHDEDPSTVPSEFLRMPEAAKAFNDTATTYLNHRRGYSLCGFHALFLGIVMAILAMQDWATLEYSSRAAITRALFPTSVFGSDLTMETSAVLDSKADVLQWIDTTFTGTGGIFADPSCGNGECDSPLEIPAWRESAVQHGGECVIDCGSWSTPKRKRSARIQLKADTTLGDAEVEQLRWNVFCPEVTQFAEQVKYFDEDQGVNRTNTTYDVDQTVYLFDCEWELRVYAPVGGVSGAVTYTDVGDNATAVTYSAVASGSTTTRTRTSKSTYSWDACKGADAAFNEVVGTVQICSDDTAMLFNRSAFVDTSLQQKLQDVVTSYIYAWIEEANQPVYYNIAPTCGACAGPGVINDCTGDPCPSFAYENPDGVCPTLCASGQANGTVHSAAEVAAACTTTTTTTTSTTTTTTGAATSTASATSTTTVESTTSTYVDASSSSRGPVPSPATVTMPGSYTTTTSQMVATSPEPSITDEYTTNTVYSTTESFTSSTTSQVPTTTETFTSSTTTEMPMTTESFVSSTTTHVPTTTSSADEASSPPAVPTTTTASGFNTQGASYTSSSYPAPQSRRELFDYGCLFQSKTYDTESIKNALFLHIDGFSMTNAETTAAEIDFDNSIYPNAQCVTYTVKIGSANDTERDFFTSVFQEHSENVSSAFVSTVSVDITAMAGLENAAAASSIVTSDAPGAVCNSSMSCVAQGMQTDALIDYLDSIGVASNPCTFLSSVYGCSTAGCGCPYPACVETSGCNGKSCDNFPWDSCQSLEQEAGCDCSGCACSAGSDCANSCMGMSCADLLAISNDDIGYLFEHPDASGTPSSTRKLIQSASYSWLENAFGCDCSGCPDPSTGGSTSQRRHLSSYQSYYAPSGAPNNDSPTPSSYGTNPASYADSYSPQSYSSGQYSYSSGQSYSPQSYSSGQSYSSPQSYSYGGYSLPSYSYANQYSSYSWYSWYDWGYAYWYSYWYYYGWYYYYGQYGDYYANSYADLYYYDAEPDVLTRAQQVELADTWPLSEYYCDATADSTGECSLELLMNGVCDRACATAACGWDFADCCNPEFVGTTKSLATRTDTTLITFRISNDDSTPYEAVTAGELMPRYVANSHRLVGGVLLDQTRLTQGNCSTPSSSAGHVKAALARDSSCPTSTLETDIIGSDPMFARRSALFDSELNATTCHGDRSEDVPGFPFVRFPQMDDSVGALWGAAISEARDSTNDAGFFNVTSLSYFELEQLNGGYPLFFDCNFDQARAARYLDYMTDGFYIDEQYTEDLTLKLLLYNQDSELATYVRADFVVEESGTLSMTKTINIFRPEQYADDDVWAKVEMIFEIAYVVFIGLSALQEVMEFVWLCRERKQLCAYFSTFWNYLDVATLAVQVVAIFLWIDVQACLTEEAFAPRLNYDIYDIDENCPMANLARFNNSEVTELRLLYAGVDHLALKRTQYKGAAMAIFTLMFLQMLKVLDFQPRLSLITKTLEVAGVQLINFLILFVLVLFIFAMMGHVIYGSTVDSLSSYGEAQLTMLYILFGGTDVGSRLSTLYGFAGIFYYFLFILFASMLLMNMLLAILVDAYIAVKKKSMKARGVFKDIALQTKASMRAISRPKRVLSNAEVKKKLDALLRRPTTKPDTKFTIPLGIYQPSKDDVERVLLRLLETEEMQKKIKAGELDAASARKDAVRIAESLLYHHGIRERPKGSKLAPASPRGGRAVGAKGRAVGATYAVETDIESVGPKTSDFSVADSSTDLQPTPTRSRTARRGSVAM